MGREGCRVPFHWCCARYRLIAQFEGVGREICSVIIGQKHVFC